MTDTVISPSAGAIAAGLAELANWYATHPSAPMVTPVLNIPLPLGTPAARRAALDEIAGRFGTEVTGRDGVPVAERWFGPVLVEAHLSLLDMRPSGLPGRSARRGSGTAA